MKIIVEKNCGCCSVEIEVEDSFDIYGRYSSIIDIDGYEWSELLENCSVEKVEDIKSTGQ